MIDLKKKLNLNSYEWWRNHRRFVTLGLFIALAAGYVRAPIARDFKVKDTCSLKSARLISTKEAARRLNIMGASVPPSQYNQLSENVMQYCDSYLAR